MSSASRDAEVRDGALELRRAPQAVRAAVERPLAHDGRAALGAARGHPERLPALPRVGMRSTTSGITSPARTTRTVSPARTSLRAISSRLCRVARLDGDAADRHGPEHGHGRERAGAPDLHHDVLDDGLLGARRELEGERPARVPRRDAEPPARGQVVELDHDAVDLVSEPAAPRVHLPVVLQDLVHRRRARGVGRDRDPPVGKGGDRLAAGLQTGPARDARGCRSRRRAAGETRSRASRAGAPSRPPRCAGWRRGASPRARAGRSGDSKSRACMIASPRTASRAGGLPAVRPEAQRHGSDRPHVGGHALAAHAVAARGRAREPPARRTPARATGRRTWAPACKPPCPGRPSGHARRSAARPRGRSPSRGSGAARRGAPRETPAAPLRPHAASATRASPVRGAPPRAPPAPETGGRRPRRRSRGGRGRNNGDRAGESRRGDARRAAAPPRSPARRTGVFWVSRLPRRQHSKPPDRRTRPLTPGRRRGYCLATRGRER